MTITLPYSIILSAETMRRLRLHADPMLAFKDTSRDLGNGFFEVPIGADTHERLETVRFEGESDDALISRVIEFMEARGLN